MNLVEFGRGETKVNSYIIYHNKNATYSVYSSRFYCCTFESLRNAIAYALEIKP